jgi:hypothetical protein
MRARTSCSQPLSDSASNPRPQLGQCVGIVRRRSANARTSHRCSEDGHVLPSPYPITIGARARRFARARGSPLSYSCLTMPSAARSRVSARRGALERNRRSGLPPELGVLEQRDRFNAV